MEHMGHCCDVQCWCVGSLVGGNIVVLKYSRWERLNQGVHKIRIEQNTVDGGCDRLDLRSFAPFLHCTMSDDGITACWGLTRFFFQCTNIVLEK